MTIWWKRTQSMGFVINLYVEMIFSICFPHVDDVSALSICIVLRAFVVISMCLLYVSLGTRVSTIFLGLMFMGSVMLSICSSSCVLYSAGWCLWCWSVRWYMLKSVGESTPPCETQFLNWRCVDVLFLNVVYALRPLM